MTRRYIVRPTQRFVHGSRLFEVIDTQNDKCCYDSILEFNCHARAKKLNHAEASLPGGFNGRLK